ncbi:MAG: peptidoglycan editing factor PgeF [Sphingorhabdus sp.]|uniref:peptidoglycan editing factor PgeF n=1 Tax=Sphingorhabdus sp. TaxID=1902408 RepID=UPI0038FC2FCF
MDVAVIKATNLGDVPHGFLGRIGGVSTGIYAGLNCSLGSDDARENVLENRRRAIASILPGAALARVYQIHSPDVLTVAGPIDQDSPPKADALVTNRPNILLGVQTADCVPVLFCDAQAGVVGAAHSGWKGAISGINENTIIAMEALGASRDRISCAIGPCIAQKSYEVDEGFFRRFVDTASDYERFFRAGKPGHYQFDIEGFVAGRLGAAGVMRVQCLGEDTYSQPERFFSYRRSCHLDENGYGGQMALIALPV